MSGEAEDSSRPCSGIGRDAQNPKGAIKRAVSPFSTQPAAISSSLLESSCWPSKSFLAPHRNFRDKGKPRGARARGPSRVTPPVIFLLGETFLSLAAPGFTMYPLPASCIFSVRSVPNRIQTPPFCGRRTTLQPSQGRSPLHRRHRHRRRGRRRRRGARRRNSSPLHPLPSAPASVTARSSVPPQPPPITPTFSCETCESGLPLPDLRARPSAAGNYLVLLGGVRPDHHRGLGRPHPASFAVVMPPPPSRAPSAHIVFILSPSSCLGQRRYNESLASRACCSWV